MHSKKQILKYFNELNDELRTDDQQAEIGIMGGAVMCIVYNARAATKDVDAIFEPSEIVRKAAAKIAKRHNLAPDWLNDGAKGFLAQKFKREEVARLSHLRIWAPETRYMLAMKCISARWDSSDRDDVKFLIERLELKTSSAVFNIIESYYPKKIIPPKTQFFIEELFEGLF
jgi:hypothetical protein